MLFGHRASARPPSVSILEYGVDSLPADCPAVMAAPRAQVTQLLLDHQAGDARAFDRLFPIVYDELHRIAHRHLQRERAGHTLKTTALVHECYLDLADHEGSTWEGRAHFLAVASKAMRHILIDYARKRNAQKRGGGQHRVTLDEGMMSVEAQAAELLSLNDALSQLEALDARLAQVVECRFFGGMTVQETALALGTSERTVRRDWQRAKAYLYRTLHPDSPPPTHP